MFVFPFSSLPVAPVGAFFDVVVGFSVCDCVSVSVIGQVWVFEEDIPCVSSHIAPILPLFSTFVEQSWPSQFPVNQILAQFSVYGSIIIPLGEVGVCPRGVPDPGPLLRLVRQADSEGGDSRPQHFCEVGVLLGTPLLGIRPRQRLR